MRWRLFARRKGRHAAGVPAAAPLALPVVEEPGGAAYGVQLTFTDGSSVALPETSPYTLAMRTTAALLLSTEVRQRR